MITMGSLKEEWDMVESQLAREVLLVENLTLENEALRAEVEAYAHTETLMQHQINGLESEVERLTEQQKEDTERLEAARTDATLGRKAANDFYQEVLTLRAEVERLTERNEALEKGLATKVSLHTARITELEGQRTVLLDKHGECLVRISELEGMLEAALTQLDGACRRAGDDTDTIHIETQQARAALSQEKK
jgi:chromosome segregation ATPase